MTPHTFLAENTVLRGLIRGNGEVEVAGHIEGEVEIDGDLIVQPSATLKANLRAQRILVRGSIAGDLTALQAIHLEAGARVVGSLRAPVIAINEGALVRGRVETGQQEETSTRRPPAARTQVPPSESRREARPEPVREARPEPVREARPEPVREARPEPVREARPEPVREARPEPVREPQRMEPRPAAPRIEPRRQGGTSAEPLPPAAPLPPPRPLPPPSTPRPPIPRAAPPFPPTPPIRPLPPPPAPSAPIQASASLDAEDGDDFDDPPPPVVPALRKGIRGTMKQRQR